MNESSDTLTTTGNPRLQRRALGRYRYVRLRWRVLFALVDFVGATMLSWVRTIGRSLGIRPFDGSSEHDDPKTVLLVQLDHLGDAIITIAMLPALRTRYPEASIEVLAGPWNRAVFEAAPEVDRVHVSHVNRFARGVLWRFAWLPAMLCWGWVLRRRKIDLGIDVRGDFPVAVILWLGGARRRLGWNCGGGGFLLTDRPRYVADRPEVASRMALLEALGITPDEPARPRFTPSQESHVTIGRKLRKLGTVNRAFGPLVVLHVGAGTRAKQWPAEHWEELLGRLIVGHGAQVVLIGGGSDRNLAQRILGNRPWPGVADWTGQLSIDESAALLSRAAVMVGADSGPAHLAAAVDTPVVALFSGTNNSQQWQPHGDRVTVVRQPVACSPCHRQTCPLAGHPCMRRLTPGRVAAAVDAILQETRSVRPSETVEPQPAQEAAVGDPMVVGGRLWPVRDRTDVLGPRGHNRGRRSDST